MGKGVIHVEEPVKKCPACQGFGRDATRDSQLYCTACGGAGVVSVSPSANFKKA
jgi:DnaJ-class molecular chaperone